MAMAPPPPPSPSPPPPPPSPSPPPPPPPPSPSPPPPQPSPSPPPPPPPQSPLSPLPSPSPPPSPPSPLSCCDVLPGESVTWRRHFLTPYDPSQGLYGPPCRRSWFERYCTTASGVRCSASDFADAAEEGCPSWGAEAVCGTCGACFDAGCSFAAEAPSPPPPPPPPSPSPPPPSPSPPPPQPSPSPPPPLPPQSPLSPLPSPSPPPSPPSPLSCCDVLPGESVTWRRHFLTPYDPSQGLYGPPCRRR